MRNSSTRFLVYAGLFLALAVLFSSFSIHFGPALKVSLAPAVVIYSGILLGPVAGAAIGAGSDVLVLLVKSLPGGYFPGFTITMALYGFLGGVLYRRARASRYVLPDLIGSTLLIQVVCSLLLNTAWLVLLTGTPFWSLLVTRLPVTGISDVLYTVLVGVLLHYQDRVLPHPPQRMSS